MRGKWLIFFSVFFLACEKEKFPEGLYGYQIERLLSGGSGKVWKQVSVTENGSISRPSVCKDSVRYYFQPVTDSVKVSILIPKSGCNGYDTTKRGNANASFAASRLLFTDSLKFAGGSYWILDRVFVNHVILREQGGKTVELVSDL